MKIQSLIPLLLISIIGYFITKSDLYAQGCSDFITRLQIGKIARVPPNDPSNNIRSQPDIDSDKIGQISGGESFEILDGPICADGYTWWYIDYADLNGWTVEGTPTEYWLEEITETSQSNETTSPPNLFEILRGTAYGSGGGGRLGFDYEPFNCIDSTIFARPTFLVFEGYLGFAAYMQAIDNHGVFTVDDLIREIPSVCLNNPAGRAEAISTDGTVLPLEFSPRAKPDGLTEGYEYFMPLEAIARGGSWLFVVDDFQLQLTYDDQHPIYLGYGDDFILVGLNSQENILFVDPLSGHAKFVQADARGVFRGKYTELGFAQEDFIVIGEISGAIWSHVFIDSGTGIENHISPEEVTSILHQIYFGNGSYVQCPNFRTRLHVHMRANVSDDEANNIRSSPESGQILGQIPPGGEFTIVGGPVCDSRGDIMWWEVEFQGLRGWTAEGRDDIRWLSPVY